MHVKEVKYLAKPSKRAILTGHLWASQVDRRVARFERVYTKPEQCKKILLLYPSYDGYINRHGLS